MQLSIPDDAAPVVQHLLEAGLSAIRGAIVEGTVQMRNPAIPRALRGALTDQQEALNKWLVEALATVDQLPQQIRPQ